MERVADYIVRAIQQAGVGHIFMVSGRGILHLTDAVARASGLSGICTYHEQSAAYAAMAYAQASGILGSCLVSTGCGAANAITGALCAWQDNVPCVFISGQHMLKETTRYTGIPIRTYGSQETDIIALVKPITKYAVMLSDPEKAVYETEKALFLAKTGRKGPVWIDIPLDVQNMRIEPDQLGHFSPDRTPSIDLHSMIKETAKEWNDAKRPIILIGGGARAAGTALQELSERLQAPVVFTNGAADIYGSGNRLSIGAVGSLGGSRAGNFAIQNADFILALGTRLCSQTTGQDPAKFARGASITVVDVDPVEHTKQGVSIGHFIHADVCSFLSAFSAQMPMAVNKDWVEKCLHWKDIFSIKNETFPKDEPNGRIDLYRFADALSHMLPLDASVITDAGLEELIIPSAIRFQNSQRCFQAAAQGAMGYAIPAILGSYFAGRQNLIAVVGDGSIMMNIQELQAIRYHNIPVKIIVINNNLYAVIRSRQRDLFRTRTIGNDPSDGLGSPNFEKLSATFDIPYMSIRTQSELADGLKSLFTMEGPVLCEVMCVEDQKYLHSSYTLNQKKRLVRRPIEDLSPFLDRKIFMREMVIDPIDQ